MLTREQDAFITCKESLSASCPITSTAKLNKFTDNWIHDFITPAPSPCRTLHGTRKSAVIWCAEAIGVDPPPALVIQCIQAQLKLQMGHIFVVPIVIYLPHAQYHESDKKQETLLLGGPAITIVGQSANSSHFKITTKAPWAPSRHEREATVCVCVYALLLSLCVCTS